MSFKLSKFWLDSFFEDEPFTLDFLFILIYIMNILIKLNLAFYDKGKI